ncbi:MAG: hypothetical protein LBC59_05115 [Chitinispirillales bacterium]|jgi:hypothetical protein|nr:hypothetical protein [Chitinispirillales bacterium]
MLRKKSWFGTLAVIATLSVGMLAVGCGSNDNSPAAPSTPPFATPPASLNGAWVSEIVEGNLLCTIDNGNFEMKVDNNRFAKGTCLTSNLNFKLTITHVHSDIINSMSPVPVLVPNWYSKSELKTALNSIVPITDADFEEEFGEMFREQTGTYKLEGGFLYVNKGEGYQQFHRQ